jgi:O-methyltransferase
VADDVTQLPPPCYSRERADQVYGEAFLRAMEFVSYQRLPGDVLEFGTWNGYTARILATLMAQGKRNDYLYLFDSFEGFPDPEGSVDKGSYEWRSGAWGPGGTRSLPDAAVMIRAALECVFSGHVKIVKGWYKDTMLHLPDKPPALVHIDCDLYDSTLTVLEALEERKLYQQGMIVMFDDWNCGRASARLGQRRAVRERNLWDRCLEPWHSYGWGGQAFIFHGESDG